LLRVAAILIIVILSVLLLRKNSGESVREQYVEMVAPMGSRSFVVLSDGTEVWLNSGSKIRFSNFFGKTTREVRLEGEAYFTVAKNKDIPFIVHAADVNVTAIGTAFNVKAYADEGKVETTLDEGIVKIESTAKDKLSDPLFLKPKQKAIYSKNVVLVNEVNNQTNATEPKSVNAKNELTSAKVEVDSLADTKPFTSWKDNRWIFRHETLHDLARKLERRYDVEISFADSSIRNYTFSGSLYDESIEQVFEAIKLIAPINFRIRHKEIEISTNKYMIDKYEKLKK
jgi:ferric-dicitrate binding protein FerR (iron transport regulator)